MTSTHLMTSTLLGETVRGSGVPAGGDVSRENLSTQGSDGRSLHGCPEGFGARETSGFFVMFATRPPSLQLEDKESLPSLLPQTGKH